MIKPKTILVVGDWLVDEHWVVGRHRSDSASRSGRRHSRALQDATCSVRSLCGAGHVATILHNASRGKDPLFETIGCGLWNEKDNVELRRMLVPQNSIGVTPYYLSNDSRPAADKSLERVRLCNLAPASLRHTLGTTRIIRVYEQTQSETVIRDRLDWERQLTVAERQQITNGLPEALSAAGSLQKVDVVVVKDLDKGVVTPSLISLLRQRVPKGAEWYVSSKQWKPRWYDELPAENVRLVLVPQVAAWKAVRQGDIHSSMWLTAGGHGTKEAFSEVGKLSEQFPHAIVIVLPEGMTLFGRGARSQPGAPCTFRQTSFGDSKRLRVLPMASVFFPALITQLNWKRADRDLGRHIQAALNYTDFWMQGEFSRLREADWNPTSRQDLDLQRQHDETFVVHLVNGWDRSVSHWDQATHNNGVVTYATAKVKTLQLWRAMTEVTGFVACVPGKRKALKQLIEQGRRFGRDKSQHFAFMLTDKPGTGKSYLVKCLARQLGLRMLEFNITQMLSRSDLIAMFDKIVTDQAQNPDEGLLVFVDEINARLDGEPVYSSFLAPLEDGIYVRGGNAVKISPCFWVFAGTRPPKDPDVHGRSHESDKGSDFQSRLTLRPFELLVNLTDNEQMDAASLERNYVAAATIQRIFPDVQRLTTLALRAFELLPPSIEPRTIARIVKTFQNVQHSIVTAKNFPDGWHSECGVDEGHLREWERQRSKDNEGEEIVIDSFASNDPGEERELPRASAYAGRKSRLPKRRHKRGTSSR